MSETTPLKGSKSRARVPHDEEVFYYEDEGPGLFDSNPARYTLYGVLTVLSVAILYLFAFFLPEKFIPETTELHDIAKVARLNVTLAPISSARVIELGLQALEMSETEIETPNSAEMRPLSSNLKHKERLIMVGDVHGHYIQLRKLLRKVKFDPERDHLLVLGDFITKGPDSLKVLDFLIENNVDCILGNHEFYVLKYYAQFHGLGQPKFVTTGNMNVYNDAILTLGGFNDDPEFLLSKKLLPQHVQYINQCSVMKTLGQVPLHSKKHPAGGSGHADGIAVHAGLRWDVMPDLEEQDPVECLEMRSLIGPFYNETTDDPHTPGAVSWLKIWNQKQKAHTNGSVVYYGHDARRGLNLKKFAKGLDTGCDRGGQLSAVILWQQKNKDGVLYREQIEQVHC